MEEQKAAKMHRDERNAIILAMDIRGFTALCQKIQLRRAGIFIDEFITLVRNTLNRIFEHKAHIVIDRFLGDGFLVFIFDDADGSAKAMEAAFDIRNTLRKKITTEYAHTNIGIGIAIGKGKILYRKFGEECSADSLACPENWKGEETGIGPPVNETFRMLSLAEKDQILISDEIRKDIRDNYIWTELDSIQVKGIRVPIIPYLVLRKGKWNEERYCSSCIHCKNHEYCEKNYAFGNTHRSLSVYIAEKWELPQRVLCDKRENGQGDWCMGCDINRLSSEPEQKACDLNFLRGKNGKLHDRICCTDCVRYFFCYFNLHRGKNHVPKTELQRNRKRYCCEACKYFNEPEADCLEHRMCKN